MSRPLSDQLIECARIAAAGNPNSEDLKAASELMRHAANMRYWEQKDLYRLGPIGRHLWAQEADW